MSSFCLKLPATSANLGPGFDTLALALELFLEIEAVPSAQFSIRATGRNHDVCAKLEKNLLIETYRRTLEAASRSVIPLALQVRNEIPLGMGCGSSAAARLAGVALAVHFGKLEWSDAEIVTTAARFEGHPDNVAACWYGGLTISAGSEPIFTATIAPPQSWRAMLVLPEAPVATSESRAVLPQNYSKADVVANVQNSSLLTAAFSLGRGDLLVQATQDRLHQPYRSKLSPLLPALLQLAGKKGVLSVTLSGAGPSVLLLLDGEKNPNLEEEVLTRAASAVELIPVNLRDRTVPMCKNGIGLK